MSNSDFRLTVLGTRGSMAVCWPAHARYGGNTSCYMVQAGGQTVFLDAGSGLLSAPVNFEEPPVILLSHFHLDHLLGLGMYPRLNQKGTETLLYLPAESAAAGRNAIDSFFSPPFWPLSLTQYAGTLHLLPIPEKLRLGDLTVTCTQGSHPGGCLILRLEYHGKSIVYATDYEHGEDASARLVRFADHADLLLYDAQYTESEYDHRIGFGHSTAAAGLDIMERSGTHRLLLVHHDPQHSDEQLARMEAQLPSRNAHFAMEGECFAL